MISIQWIDADSKFISNALQVIYPELGKSAYLVKPENAANLQIILSVNSIETSQIGDYTIFDSVMVNVGDVSKPWEPYTGGKPAPSEEYPQVINVRAHGAQLFDANTIQPIVNSELSIVNNNDGSITAKGTSSRDTATNLSKINLPPGKYYISGSNGDIKAIARVEYNNQTVYYSNHSFDVMEGSNVNIFIKVDAGKTVDGTIYPMLNAGDTALPWEPYRAATVPIQLTAPLHGVGAVSYTHLDVYKRQRLRWFSSRQRRFEWIWKTNVSSDL